MKKIEIILIILIGLCGVTLLVLGIYCGEILSIIIGILGILFPIIVSKWIDLQK